MQAVVLAAGEGRRLRPLTRTTPKGLVEVGGTPILTYCFEELTSLAADEIVVVIGYRGDEIVAHYGESFRGNPLTYAHQEERRGVAHAIATAREHVSGTFMVMHGDNLFGGGLRAVLDRHERRGPLATLLVDTVPTDEAADVGVCAFDDEGTLVGLVEKPEVPPSNVVITGFFVFEPAIFEACEAIDPSDRGEYELPAAIDHLLRDGHDIELVYADDWLVNVNTPEDLARAERRLASG